jgi:hypothetical protein
VTIYNDNPYNYVFKTTHLSTPAQIGLIFLLTYSIGVIFIWSLIETHNCIKYYYRKEKARRNYIALEQIKLITEPKTDFRIIHIRE